MTEHVEPGPENVNVTVITDGRILSVGLICCPAPGYHTSVALAASEPKEETEDHDR